MEPWLDSLSEDWNSEPRGSSPVSSMTTRSRIGTHSSTASESRIPHLAQSLRKSSNTGSYLKPRSSRGIAKARTSSVLSERSPSNLNLPPSSPYDASQRKQVSTLPRRVSSVFSGSQNSVQHHAVEEKAADTPEWKRRLANGEDVVSDGFDLFSPSKLEGMFAEPKLTDNDRENQSSLLDGASKPWTALQPARPALPSTQYQSFRTSRSRLPVMEALQEVSEDGDDTAPDMSAISSELAHGGSMRGLVQRRLNDFQQMPQNQIPEHTSNRIVSHRSNDPRWRTHSGQQEIRNEVISPVTNSAKNSITVKALRTSSDLDVEKLRRRLADVSTNDGRPSSRSSDCDVSYDGQGGFEKQMHEELLPELTTHSLPEDLSMGTQELTHTRSFSYRKKRMPADETSFATKKLSSSIDNSQIDTGRGFRSSPPPYANHRIDDSQISARKEDDSLTLDDLSIVRHSPSPSRPTSIGSPLKLFGNRDTYTSNKLMRVLSHYADGESSVVDESDDTVQHQSDDQKDIQEAEQHVPSEAGLRMSQFGKGELDSFHFEKEVSRPTASKAAQSIHSAGVFDLGTAEAVQSAIPLSQRPQKSTAEADSDVLQKRNPSSPAKDRTPKRRRTLLRDEIVIEGVGVEVKVDQIPDKSIGIAGRKRKDARPGEEGGQADPSILAARSILRPKSGSRKSSASDLEQNKSRRVASITSEAPAELAEALAAELASFAQGVTEATQDSRKPSLATKDYMEEANKVMEFIRARGKPKSNLPEIQEPADADDLDPDSILDADVDDDSTKDSFSRPPSRERPVKPREDRRIAIHDPRVASHLRRFQEPDDLELLASTSVIGTFHLADNRAADEAALVPVPGDEQESSPPNIRILNHDDVSKKRKHSASTNRDLHNTSSSTSRCALSIESMNSSGQKGMITSGTVSIPDQVGTMTFDHAKQIWVKQQLIKHRPERHNAEEAVGIVREATLDDDPFDSIPDLSIDEQREAAMRVPPRSAPSSRPSTSDTVQKCTYQDRSQSSVTEAQDKRGIYLHEHPSLVALQDEVLPVSAAKMAPSEKHVRDSDAEVSLRSAASKHEERLYDGVPSKDPLSLGTSNRQPRAVTIAFSSPVVTSTVEEHCSDAPDEGSDDDDRFLPPDDSDFGDDDEPSPGRTRNTKNVAASQPAMALATRHEQYRAMTLNRRPVSRIDERDEHEPDGEGMSLVRVESSAQQSPPPSRGGTMTKLTPGYKGSSILCLTPLSEFTMHQADKANHPEESFVAARPHPKALQQAHGSLALSIDALIKAITDAASEEPFWEQLSKLNLTERSLTSLHNLQEYCPVLEHLAVANNTISQLSGLPSSLRQLDISANHLNDFTSWGHLNNLQYIDVSDNCLESLEALSSLVHVRTLKACNNQIRDIEGILDLDGLIALDLSGNQLASLDFEGVDLPRLVHLNISNNKLTAVRNLHCLPQLENLSLDANSLKDFLPTSSLDHLKTLSLARNELQSIDLVSLPLVQYVNVDHNRLEQVQGLSEARNLRKLSAREQRCSNTIINAILSSQNECEEILLSSNILTDGQIVLPAYPHYGLKRLELAGCGLQAIPSGFGDFFPNCRILNLNYNALGDLTSLRGCLKVQRLCVVGNRIRRLRRTCLTLARLQALESIDLRDNPLTVGFHPPSRTEQHALQALGSHTPNAEDDARWLQTLDETTVLRRRIIELLLAEGCKHLVELDGRGFDASVISRSESVLTKLTSRGVLIKAAPTPSLLSVAEDKAICEATSCSVQALHKANVGVGRCIEVE